MKDKKLDISVNGTTRRTIINRDERIGSRMNKNNDMKQRDREAYLVRKKEG